MSKAMKKQVLRILVGLTGLSGFGVIVAEVLKKWQFVDSGTSRLWTVGPILALFLAHETLRSTRLGLQARLSPQSYNALSNILKILLLITSLAVLISIPFLWYGVIEELAKSKR
jgi:hypothetical protein